MIPLLPPFPELAVSAASVEPVRALSPLRVFTCIPQFIHKQLQFLFFLSFFFFISLSRSYSQQLEAQRKNKTEIRNESFLHAHLSRPCSTAAVYPGV
jgi:hypothetical protein